MVPSSKSFERPKYTRSSDKIQKLRPSEKRYRPPHCAILSLVQTYRALQLLLLMIWPSISLFIMLLSPKSVGSVHICITKVSEQPFNLWAIRLQWNFALQSEINSRVCNIGTANAAQAAAQAPGPFPLLGRRGQGRDEYTAGVATPQLFHPSSRLCATLYHSNTHLNFYDYLHIGRLEVKTYSVCTGNSSLVRSVISEQDNTAKTHYNYHPRQRRFTVDTRHFT